MARAKPLSNSSLISSRRFRQKRRPSAEEGETIKINRDNDLASVLFAPRSLSHTYSFIRFLALARRSLSRCSSQFFVVSVNATGATLGRATGINCLSLLQNLGSL